MSRAASGSPAASIISNRAGRRADCSAALCASCRMPANPGSLRSAFIRAAPLLHRIALALHASAVGSPIGAHGRLLIGLRGLRLRGMLLAAAHAAGERARGRADRRAVSRAVAGHVTDDCSRRRPASRAGHARTGRTGLRRRSLRNDCRVDAGALFRPRITRALVRRLLLLALSMCGIHGRLLCQGKRAHAGQDYHGESLHISLSLGWVPGWRMHVSDLPGCIDRSFTNLRRE